MDEISRIASELVQLYDQVVHKPFPYHGCRTLLEGTDERMAGFIPDLALYFAEIAGFSCRAQKLSRWNNDRVTKAQRSLVQSFVEKHPEYRELEARITPEDTPDLYAAMALHEQMRIDVLHLTALLMDWPSDQHPS
jgi:hypothetical protein